MKKFKIYYDIFGIVIGIIGFGLIAFQYWQIAVGVFLVVWSTNIANNHSKDL